MERECVKQVIYSHSDTNLPDLKILYRIRV